MKIIRGILLFLTCVFGFILQTELFQSELWRFDMAYYLIMQYEVEDDNLKVFLNDVYTESKNNNVSVFATDIYMEKKHKTILNIYGNEKTIKKDLFRVMGIREQKYTSFISGETDINYKEFNDLIKLDNYSKKCLSFIGDEEDIIKVYESVSKKYNVSYPDYFEATEEDMVCIVWIMISILLIVLNCINTLRRKKEVALRIFLGEDIRSIIIKTIISDIIMYMTIYAFAKFFTFGFFSGEYAKDLAFTIFVIGAAISLLPYISFAFYKPKKILSNINDSKGVLYSLYGLKIIVTGLTIFAISTSLSREFWNITENDNIIYQYKDCNYITFGNTVFDNYSGEELFWNEVYRERYNDIKPVICINILHDDNDYILVNNYASDIITDLDTVQEGKSSDADFIIFINKNESSEKCKEMAIDSLNGLLDANVNKMKFQVIKYNAKNKFSYFTNNEYNTLSTTVNPVIIFQNNARISYNGYCIEEYAGNSIIFDINESDFKLLKNDYDKYINKYNCIITNVYESYNFQRNFIVKLLRFFSSFCIIISLLHISVVIAISSMEYRNNAMEISIKKILGYSIFERNRRSILIISLIDISVFVLICVIVAIINMKSLLICFLTGVVVIAVEMVILFINILKIEKENVYKVLKGGCL